MTPEREAERRGRILSGLFILSAPLIGWGLYRFIHHAPVAAPAPIANVTPKIEAMIEQADRDAAIAEAKHQALMKKKREALSARWDKCTAAHGLPVPGFDSVKDPDEWGLMCIRPGSVIYIDDTAW